MTQQQSILLPNNYTTIYLDCIECGVFMAPVAALMYVWEWVLTTFVPHFENERNLKMWTSLELNAANVGRQGADTKGYSRYWMWISSDTRTKATNQPNPEWMSWF